MLFVLYFFLTVAELFISPLGLSFVSKVAPKHLQGPLPRSVALCNGRRQSAALDWSAHLQCLSYLGGLDCILLGLHHLDGRYARYGEMARAGYRIRPVFRLIRRRFRKGGAAFI